MLRYLEVCEASKVSTRELKEQVLTPEESSISIVRVARQARSEKSIKLFQISEGNAWRSGRKWSF